MPAVPSLPPHRFLDETMTSETSLGDAPTQNEPNLAALARKRRIELRNCQRSTSNGGEVSDSDSTASNKRPRGADDDELIVDPVTSKPKPSITGIKKQSRYDPGVPMTREELKVWRKEARRVRNRESAAASRKRNRERITELEGEVDAIKSRYSAALKLIVELEAAGSLDSSFIPSCLQQDLGDARDELPRPSSPQVDLIQTVSPPMSPSLSCSSADEEKHTEEVNRKYQRIIQMISRPTACVTIT